MNKSITRRVLALVIVCPYVLVSAYLAYSGNSEAFIALGTLATMAGGYYLGVTNKA